MRFKNNNIYQMSADSFSGIDLSERDKGVLSNSAAMAENVFVNNQGEIEKRRGYKILYKTEKSLNGVYEYTYKAGESVYISHEGDSLYTLAKTDNGFEREKLIYSGISDKESCGFCFGGALFIMCDGYYKICYDEFFDRIAVALVSKAHTKDEVLCVVENRTKGNFDGEVLDFINKEYMYQSIKFKFDTYHFDEVAYDENKLYIAKNEFLNQFRVVSLKINDIEIECYQYKILSDEKGIYIKLERTNTNVKPYYEASPEVVICYTGFVYTPEIVTSRLPVGVDDLYGYLIEGYKEQDSYTGVYTQDLNLASPVRKMSFYINTADHGSAKYLRCCLDAKNKNGRVLKITVGGNVLNGYFIQKDAYDKDLMVYPHLGEFVDFDKSYLISVANSNEFVVEIEYFSGDFESQIDGCDIFGFFDGANDLRVFLAGNEKYPCRDYASEVYDASYFPELLYTNVGNETSKILGYGRYFGYQLIFKDSLGDAEIYFRTTADDSFKILKGTSSEAAAGKNAVININSTLFLLSDSGLYSVDATSVEGQNKNTLRSKEINSLLLSENLSKIKMSKVDNMLYLFGEKYVYILDIARGFKWYIYSFPCKVRCAKVFGGDVILYENAIAALKDEDDSFAYTDDCVDGEKANVLAYWKTNNVCFMPFKRRDILSAYCSLSDFFLRNGAEILYNSEDFSKRKSKKANANLFSFLDIDFSNFSFRCIREGLSIKTHLRAKRVEKFSLTLKNDKNEQMKINKIGFLYR